MATFAMNAVWMTTCEMPDIRIYTFEWMSNHFHALLSGTKQRSKTFIDRLRAKIRRFAKTSKLDLDLSGFTCEEPIEIISLDSFRNVTVYINRNNFVANPHYTPFSYPYGANAYLFNDFAKRVTSGTYGELTVAQRRRMTHSHNVDYPCETILIDGYASPISYCDIDFAERTFRDARHYFTSLSKAIESSKEIAKILGDKVYYTDNELFSVVMRICDEEFGGNKPSLLRPEHKLELAKRLRFEYNAGNGQIQRMLKLDRRIVDELFPQ